MKLRTKITLIYIPSIVIPLLITALMFLSVSTKNIKVLTNELLKNKVEEVATLCILEQEKLYNLKLHGVPFYVNNAQKSLFSYLDNLTISGGVYLIIHDEKIVYSQDSTITLADLNKFDLYSSKDKAVETENFIGYTKYNIAWDWFIFVRIEKKIIFNDINTLVRNFVLGLILLTILVFILIVRLSRSISSPLEKINIAILEFTNDDTIERSISHKNDEFEIITNSFDRMKTQINKQLTTITSISNYLSSIINNAPDLICGITKDGITTFVNPAIVKISGYSETELVGNNWWEMLYPGEQKSQVTKLFKEFKKGDVTNYEMQLICKDGSIKDILWNSFTHYDIDNNITDIIGFGRDITERKKIEYEKEKLQIELIQSQKMEAIGQLAGGVAHDFNNVISGIMAAAQILKSPKRVLDEKSLKFVDLIYKSTLRAADLTAKLLAYGRKGNNLKDKIDIHQILDESIDIFNTTIDKKITITVNKLAKKSVILGNSDAIQNSIINLGINASHSMNNGGVLTFSTEEAILDSLYCSQSSFDIKPGNYIKLSVQDTGYGIDEKTIKKIFEPFFTTKDKSKGTGLGLASVYGTIQQHNAAITVESKLGVGTTFNTFFPISMSSTRSTLKPRSEEMIYGYGTIMLIDDEEAVRITGRHLLEEMGYNVMDFENGLKALETFKTMPNKIDIVITDMIMPNITGQEIFYKLKEIDSNCKIILTSGFTMDKDINTMQKDGLSGFIGKPFNHIKLSQLINKILKEL